MSLNRRFVVDVVQKPWVDQPQRDLLLVTIMSSNGREHSLQHEWTEDVKQNAHDLKTGAESENTTATEIEEIL